MHVADGAEFVCIVGAVVVDDGELVRTIAFGPLCEVIDELRVGDDVA